MRRRRLIIALGFVLASVTASAQWAYLNSEQFTVTTTARGFTSTKITPSGLTQATRASCDLETADVRYTIDNTAVSTYYGQYWSAGTSKVISGHDALVNFSTILATSTVGAKFDCTYSAP